MDGGGAMRRVEGHARERGWGGVIEWLGIARLVRDVGFFDFFFIDFFFFFFF